MRISSFRQMTSEYEKLNIRLSVEDLELRNSLLKIYKYSFIVEGGATEFDNLLKWFDNNIGTALEDIFYAKTDYDYHFAEFFLNNETDLKSILQNVPNIYTTYPSSYPPGRILKSDGSIVDIEYKKSDIDVIIF